MIYASFKTSVAALLLSAMLGACGGGGGGSVASEGGIGGSGISRGTITDFGSVWVNGVEFETDAATISVNGDDSVTQSALNLGMVVTVTGTINADGISGTATRVDYERHLEGPIDAVVSASELMVAGQTVLVDGTTQFEGISAVTSLAGGNVVQVSGFRNANGEWRATYLGLTAPVFVNGAGEVEVKGAISGLLGSTFMIGTLSVDASGLTLAGLSNGSYVEVQGGSFGDSGELIATRIELEDSELGVEEADEAELQGLITAVNSASEFVVGGQTVRIGDGTEFEGGVAADIRVGLRVEVEGSVAGGIFTVEEVSFEDDVELEANVSAVNIGAGTLALAGLGLTVSVNDALIEFEGVTGLSEIQVGDHVQVRGRLTGSAIEATTLNVDGDSDTVVLRGSLDSRSGTVVSVLGVNIDVDTVGTDGDDVLDLANIGDAVELRGTLDGGTILWDEIELDD